MSPVDWFMSQLPAIGEFIKQYGLATLIVLAALWWALFKFWPWVTTVAWPKHDQREDRRILNAELQTNLLTELKILIAQIGVRAERSDANIISVMQSLNEHRTNVTATLRDQQETLDDLLRRMDKGR